MVLCKQQNYACYACYYACKKFMFETNWQGVKCQ